MNKKRIAISFVVLSVFAFEVLLSQESRTNQLVVFGNAEVKVPANKAELNFSVKGVGPTLRVAVESAKEKVGKISTALYSIGLDKKNLNTTYFYSGENVGDKAFLSSSRDFKAMITVFVTIDSLDLLERVVIGISEGDVEYISNVAFAVRDEAELKTRARDRALAKAKEKAKSMAEQLNIQLTKIIYVEEDMPEQFFLRGGRSNYPNPFNESTALTMRAGVVSASSPVFFPQTISVSAGVKLIYEIGEGASPRSESSKK